jgi:hypothetical protein
MKTLTIRLPTSLLAEIEREARARRLSKSDVARERLSQPVGKPPGGGSMQGIIEDLVGSVGGLPPDLSSRKKEYLREIIRAKKLHRR